MNFEGLKNRVERAETLLDGRVVQTTDRYRALRVSWNEAWTPGRIMIAGLIAGFVAGNVEPKRAMARLGKVGKLAGPKSLQMISAISGLLTSIQTAVAAATASKAAATADDAAQTADAAADDVAAKTGGADLRAAAAAGAAAAQTQAQANTTRPPSRPVTPSAVEAPDVAPPPRSDRRRPDPVLSEQPRPAEASTELSESGR